MGLLDSLSNAIYGTAAGINRVQDDPKGLLSEGLAKAAAQVQQQLDASRAMHTVSPDSVFAKQAFDTLLNGALNTGGLLAMPTVYHGTPHNIQGSYDLSKIGTGEGAQAFGHGIYFAENPAVARDYATTLQKYKTEINGVPVTPDHPKFPAIMSIGANGYDKALQMAQHDAGLNIYSDGGAYANKILDDIKSLKSDRVTQVGGGNLYQQTLPDSVLPKMLQWDKPLSEQPEAVQKAIAQTKRMLPPNAMEDLGGDMSLLYGPSVTGSEWLGTMASLTGSQKGGEDMLRKVGIPGLSYLDAGSRGAGNGTMNHVIWDQGLLNQMIPTPVK